MDIENWLKSNKDCIIRIIELEDVQSKSDPCEQPYKSQYAARDIMQTCITDLDELMKKNKDCCCHLTNFVYFNLSYRLANNFISTEERYSGEEIIFSLCNKIEKIPYLQLFLKQLNKVSPTGDIHRLSENKNFEQVTPLGESKIDESLLWVSWLAGIILRIYNASGLLWGGRIVNLPTTDTTDTEDTECDNSIKYLSRAKRIYKTYKQQMLSKDDQKPMESHTEITLNYEPPECFDSLLLTIFQYETPYLINECYLLDGVDKKKALKFDMFESEYTTCLFLLAQTFGKMSSKSQMKHKSAKYCYWTLYRQLNALKYDPVEWAINAATLSQYYVVEGVFRRARHCIAAAQIILKEAVSRPTPGPIDDRKFNQNKNTGKTSDVVNGKSNNTSENDLNSKETKGNADAETVSDCDKTIDGILEDSINKVIEQLNISELPKEAKSSNADESETDCKSQHDTDKSENDKSKEDCPHRKLLPDPMSESRMWDDDVYEEKRVQGEADIDRCWISYGLNLLEMSFDRTMPDYSGPSEKDKFTIEAKLPDFNLELAVIEREITYEWVYSYEEARQVFLFVQRKINSARQYYRLDFRCSDAIDLICDHSKAYKFISSYETNTDRKCIMHKKRIDMLTELLKTLNQQYYQIPCRKMMLEIGEIYSSMMNLKLSLLETTSGSDDSIKLPANAKGVVQKIRLLGKKGISVYEDFLESYRTPNGILPEVYAEDDIRPVLIAHFYMARMFSKILEPDSNVRLKNLVKSLEQYQFIVNFCNKYENAAKQMSSELESCKDMVVLLPRKIDKLRSEI